jgi:hypothetical protein
LFKDFVNCGNDFGPELNKLFFNFWCYRKFMRILGSALDRVGIILFPVEEMHTRQVLLHMWLRGAARPAPPLRLPQGAQAPC